jgi:hypothetical protein
VATLDTQRQILFTGNDTGVNFTIVGTDEDGATITEVVAGTGTTATSVRSYKTVTRITTSAAMANATTVGTNGVGDSQWQIVNRDVTPMNFGLAVVASGTVNFTVSYTYDDPSLTYRNPLGSPPNSFDLAALAAKAATTDAGSGTITWPIAALRLRINSGTGTAVLAIIQAGVMQ